jgi:hypothetical protein
MKMGGGGAEAGDKNVGKGKKKSRGRLRKKRREGNEGWKKKNKREGKIKEFEEHKEEYGGEGERDDLIHHTGSISKLL